MWRRELIRFVLAANWVLAGGACGMVIYGHNLVWGSVCFRAAHAEMVAEGVYDPIGSDTGSELERRCEAVRARFVKLDRMGYYGWLFAMCGGAGTAIGLMIAFPKPVAAKSAVA